MQIKMHLNANSRHIFMQIHMWSSCLFRIFGYDLVKTLATIPSQSFRELGKGEIFCEQSPRDGWFRKKEEKDNS